MDSRKRPPMSHPKSTRSHVSPVHGKTSEVVHIIRVTVQGLTGLTLNQNWKGDKETTNDENRKPKTDSNILNGDVESGSESVLKTKPPKKSKIKAISVIPKVPKTTIPKVPKSITPETSVIPYVPNPDKLRAFITLSRSSTIVGTSNLSEPFHRLHEHDVVGTSSIEASDEFEVPNMLDLERYAAIWPSTENSDMDRYAISPAVLDDANSIASNTTQCGGKGIPILNNEEDLPSNVISFETKLRRSVTKRGTANNCGGSIYGYAPKSFEIIVGLASMENNNDGAGASSVKNEKESLFYVPLGIATLAINTQHQELELPVLSLSQGRPAIAVGEKRVPCVGQHREDATSVSLDTGLGGSNSQLKAKIASIQSGGDCNTQQCNMQGGKVQWNKFREGKAQKGTRKQKRRGRWGIFGSKKRDPKKDEIFQLKSEECNTDKDAGSRGHHPTAHESATFTKKYSIGSSCKAVLRLKVEVFEKAVDREKSSKEVCYQRKESCRKKSVSVDRKHLKAFYELNRTLTPDVALIDISDSEGDLTEYPSDASDNSDNISEYTGASWDTVSTMSTQGTHGTTFTTASWHSGSTGSTRGGRTNVPGDEDENDKTASSRRNRIEDSDDNEDALSNIEDEEESADDSHLTVHFGSKKFRVSTPNPIHVACQGRDNATWLAEKSTAVGKICNEKVWNWKHDAEEGDKCNSAESPHGVNEFSSIPRQSVVDKIPKALTFSERQETIKQSVLDAISCQGSRACRQKYQTDPIEVAILTARSMVSLDCDDIRELRTEGALARHQTLEGAK